MITEISARKPKTTTPTQACDLGLFAVGVDAGDTIGLEGLTSFCSFFVGLGAVSFLGNLTSDAVCSSLAEGLTAESGVISTKGRPKSVGSGHSRGVESFVAMVVWRKYETNLKLGKAQPFSG